MDIQIELTLIGDAPINKELVDKNRPLNIHTN